MPIEIMQPQQKKRTLMDDIGDFIGGAQTVANTVSSVSDAAKSIKSIGKPPESSPQLGSDVIARRAKLLGGR